MVGEKWKSLSETVRQGMAHDNVGKRFEEQIKREYEAVHERFDKQEEERVIKFQNAVRRQLVKLVVYLKRLGKRNESDLLECTYGDLFEAVQNDMATLSGTLKTARRMGIVSWNGPETLFQTADDDVVIVLLQEDEEAEFRPVVREKGSLEVEEVRDPFVLDAKISKKEACYKCGEAVEKMDRIGVSEVVMHRKCFVCHQSDCGVQLTAARYGSLMAGGEKKEMHFYCIPHYEAKYKVNADYRKGFE